MHRGLRSGRASAITLAWNGPLKDVARAGHSVSVRMSISAIPGGLTFGIHVTNGSQLKVLEAWYPLVGGLTGFGSSGGKSDATLWVPTSTPTERAVVPTAGGATFGYPGQMNMSFACVQSKSAGKTLYFASQDPVARYKTFRFVETGAAGATDMAACIQHTPILPPGQQFDGSPVVLRFADGDWVSASRIYREWFQSTFGIDQPADDWIRRQSFFLMTMFMPCRHGGPAQFQPQPGLASIPRPGELHQGGQTDPRRFAEHSFLW